MADQVPYLWATFQPGMILYNSSIVHDLAGGTFPDGAAYPPLSDGVVPLVQVSVTH
jgi:hypothetical protein